VVPCRGAKPGSQNGSAAGRTRILGESLDADHIEAGYEHGVLTLRIPVSEEAKPRKIQVGGQAALTS
jgi:HSP20 family molecular chaperone IbpA